MLNFSLPLSITRCNLMINLPIRKCHSAQTHVPIVNKAGDSDIYLISALIPVSKSMACKVSTLVPVNWLESKKDRKNIALVPRKTWILEAEKRYSPTQDHNRRGSRWIGLGSVVVFIPTVPCILSSAAQNCLFFPPNRVLVRVPLELFYGSSRLSVVLSSQPACQ